MRLISESWRGERPLITVFWRYYIGFYFVYGVALFLVLSLLPKTFSMIVLMAAVIFLFPYNIWVLVSIWRCARNSSPTWRNSARFWVALTLVGFIVRVLIAIPDYRNYAARLSLSQKVETLRSAGFSEQEIDEWIAQETDRMKDADASPPNQK